MSSLNKAAFRIIGVFALIVGVVFLSTNIPALNHINTMQSFMRWVASSVISCIGIYGGFQLLKLRKIGHRLLIIWLLSQILTIVFAVPALISGLFFSGEFPFTVRPPILTPLIIAYYLSSPVVLIYLLASRTTKESLTEDNPRYIRVLTILLSLLTPGLARALVGNLLIGMVLFYSYWLLITNPAPLSGSPEFLDLVGQLLYYIGGWAILVAIDWSAMKDFEKSERMKNSSAPGVAPEQVTGG